MDIARPGSSGRRSTLTIPPKPDASLAEWTSKIKFLQSQVDDDKEKEARRLEEEITASRQARMRRSTYGSRANSVDLSGLASPTRVEDHSVVSDEPLSIVEVQKNQDAALKKLIGEDTTTIRTNRSPVPTLPGPAPVPAAPHSQSKRSSSPISLAAFMGGRATGPKLTQHRPQQNAHDPTQFDQRTEISAPHPVFGRGGVAMPGMTGNGKASVVSRAIREEEVKVAVSTPLSQRDRRISTPTTTTPVRSAVERAQARDREREVVPNHTGWSQTSTRQRTISTPTGTAPSKHSSAETSTTKPKPESMVRPLSHSTDPVIRPVTPRASMGSLVQQSGSKSPAPRPPSATLHTPPPPSPTRSPKPTTPVPGLARPIQPSPRPSIGSPQMPPSVNASPAFSRSLSSKEPTPSLSRLKGRGFVKGIVERSDSLGVGSPDGSPTPERTGKRQSSVLDRWQHAPGGSPSPPVISPKPMPLRKSFTVDPSLPSPTYSIPLKRESTEPVLKSKSSLPTLRAMRTGESIGASSVVSDGHDGLGSSKTVITFIQPTRTGDRPLSQPQHEQETDELGMRVRARTISSELVQERGEPGSPPTGKPLSHPTKDRAKKPRKGRSAPAAAASSTLAVIREASPTRNEPAPTKLRLQVAETRPSPLTPPSTYTPVRTTSPISQYPSPPATKGRAVSPVSPPQLPPKPSFDVILTPTTATKVSPPSPLAPPPAVRSPSVTPPQSTAQTSEKAPPLSPRHTRIPSTGNRATVMDVAQAFTEALHRQPSPSASPELRDTSPPSSLGAFAAKGEDEDEEEYTPPSVRNLVANWGPRSTVANGAISVNGGNSATTTTTIMAPPLEKRKSSYEKYSAFILPPLTEERTPVPSPAGTLKHDAAPAPELLEEDIDIDIPVARIEEEFKVPRKPVVFDEVAPPAAAVAIAVVPTAEEKQIHDEIIHLNHADEPLPLANIDALYCAPRPTYTPDPDVMTISVEVLSIAGSAAALLNSDVHVFYDSELLAVVHRAKVKSSGLVTTKVWQWHGRRAQPGERETQKVQELSRRYGTAPIMVQQAREPPEFVSVLGGKLATRQGTRAHWSAENTAMHVVRSSQGLTFIDELDLSIRNLCSGFSYCISILDTFYVWHGRGSIAAEQRAALEYARALASAAEQVVELTEEESQADEMFWMILGDGEYAKADYWRWRAGAPFVDPRVWAVDASQDDLVRSVSVFPPSAEFSREVHLVDCIWELFVVIGSEARGRRLDIRLALNVAEGLAQKASSMRPFTPPIHTLIFPTQIPTDLLLTFRDLDETELNAGDIPDHMNLIPACDADANLKLRTWSPIALQDHTMLPVGVSPSNMD